MRPRPSPSGLAPDCMLLTIHCVASLQSLACQSISFLLWKVELTVCCVLCRVTWAECQRSQSTWPTVLAGM